MFVVLGRLSGPRLLLRQVWAWVRELWLLWLLTTGAIVVGLLLWAAAVEPAWLLPDTHGLNPADRVKAQTDFRNTLVTMLGGLAVLVGAIVGGFTLRETSRQNRAIQEQSRAVLDLQRRGQVTERFTRAIDQLGSEKLDVRIGAIYALEQIARDSAELHWAIMEVLTAYLRDHAPFPSTGDTPADAQRRRIPADHQAIATVIGRRRREQDPDDQWLDFHRTNLPGVRWGQARLERADLSEANLERANLDGAQLQGAGLIGTHLQGANLRWAELESANLLEAQLKDANLWGASFFKAHLEGADFSNARGLTWAQLQFAADLSRANLPTDLALQVTQATDARSSTPPAPVPDPAAEEPS